MLAGIPVGDLVFLAVSLVAAGAVTGLLAGVFGVGGGAVIVPILYEVFRVIGVPEDVRMPLCVGTSLAVIIPTSIRSFNAHQAPRGMVDMDDPEDLGDPGRSRRHRRQLSSPATRPPAVFKIGLRLRRGLQSALAPALTARS
jgi:hypothetical protein